MQRRCRTVQTAAAELISMIDPETDSLRFYSLGNNYKSKIEHIGAKAAYLPDDILLL